MSDPIRITHGELEDPHVDEVLAQEAAYRGAWEASDGTGSSAGRGLDIQAVAFTMFAGLTGALIGWGIIEPWFDDNDPSIIWTMLLIMCVAAFASAFIGACDGLLSRAWGRAGTGFGMGLGVGIVAGLVASIAAGLLFGIGVVFYQLLLMLIAPGVMRGAEDPNPQDFPMVLLVAIMCARCMGWSLVGVSLGLAPGLMQRSRDLLMVGILGGVVGGFLGGLVFDPIGQFFTDGTDATVSRAVGFSFIGAVTGLSIGLVEQLSKDAWLFMEEGPLAGKQFVLYKDPTHIGSSPKCDVYLFKDPDIDPQHARLNRTGAAHEIQAMGSGAVIVNGKRINRIRLDDGDQIRIGKAKFRYYVRRKRTGRRV